MLSLRVALALGRTSNLPTVWSNVAAGAVLAGGRAQLAAIADLLVSMSLIYVAGMFLNDAFDRKIDAVERPDRPIVAGLVSARTVFFYGYAMLVAGVALLIPLGAGATAGGAILAGLVIAYDVFHKNNPFSPLLMGLCRVMVYLTAGIALSAGTLPAPVWIGAIVLLAYLIGLTYAAKQENTERVSHAAPLAGLLAPVAYAFFHPMSALTWIALAVFAGWTGRCLWLALSPQRRIRAAVGGLIAGIALNDALLIALHSAPAWAAAAGAAFGLTMLFQRRIAGT
jgi:4-hydroxybenzoate polyprenyltransferase